MFDSLQPHGLQPTRLLCQWILQAKMSGLSCPPPGGLPDPGVEPESSTAPALQAESLPLSHQGSPKIDAYTFLKF